MTTSSIDSVPAGALTDPEFWAGAQQDLVFRQFRHSAPLSWQEEPATEWNPDGGPGYWSVVSHDLISQVSKTPEIFGSRYGTEIIDHADVSGAGMLNMDAPEHTRLRSIVARVFTPRRVNTMMAHIRERADALVDKLAAMDEFDFVAEVAETYPAGIVADVMGVDPADLPRLVELTKEILSPPAPNAQRANNEMIAYGKKLARERAAGTGDDLVSMIVRADAEGQKCTEEEVGIFFALLLTAGIETTGTALNHAILALHAHPEQRQLWLTDYAAMAPVAVEEILRWASPVRRFRRTALVDAELGGTPIAAGDKVVMWYMSGNRDEKAFTNPETFDITRSPNPHVAFGGGGPHFCLGGNLARAEITAFLDAFLHKMPNYEIVGSVEYARNDAFNAVAALPCRPGR